LGLKKVSTTDLLSNPWISANLKSTSTQTELGTDSVRVSLKELMNISSGDQQALSALKVGHETDSLSQDFQMK
jgi:hypothetical protein